MYFSHIHLCFYFIILLHFFKRVFLLGICGQCGRAEKRASNEISVNG